MAPKLPVLVTLCDIWHLMVLGRGCHFGSNGRIYIFNFIFLYTVFNFKVKNFLFHDFFIIFYYFFSFFCSFSFSFWLIVMGHHTYGLYLETFFMCKIPISNYNSKLRYQNKSTRSGWDWISYQVFLNKNWKTKFVLETNWYRLQCFN